MADTSVITASGLAGLFGIPGVDPRQQQEEAVAFKNAQLTPMQQLSARAIGRGKAAGREIAGLFGVEDPIMKEQSIARQVRVELQQQGLNPSSPEYWDKMVGRLGELGASKAQAEATNIGLQVKEKVQKIATDKATEAAKLREKVPAIDEQAATIRFNELVQQYGPVEGAKKYRAEQLAAKKSVAAAGVPQPGMVGLSDLKGAQDLVNQYTKAPKEKLEKVGEIGVLINEISKNPTALPQLQRSLVKLAGDSQIGQNEVKNILGSSGFTADIIDGVNKFLTGAPTNAKIQDVARGVKAIEQFYAKQYEQGRETSKRVLSNAKLDERTIADLIPKAYSTGPKAPSLNEWLIAAKRANPNASDAELTQYYNNKYAK